MTQDQMTLIEILSNSEYKGYCMIRKAIDVISPEPYQPDAKVISTSNSLIGCLNIRRCQSKRKCVIHRMINFIKRLLQTEVLPYPLRVVSFLGSML